MGYGDHFALYNYQGDDGNTYNIKLSAADAAASAMTASTTYFPVNAWGFKAKDLRHVTGKTSAGKKGRLVVGSAAHPLYKGTQQAWTNSNTGASYNVTGIEGENRKGSHVK
jgi:hypothetical protein